MTLADFALLADENLHPEVVAYLQQSGFDVLDVRAAGLVGCADVALMRQAYATRRVILTHDRDFGALALAAHEPLIGLVYLRPGHLDPGFTIDSLRALYRHDLALTPPFVLVAERRQERLRIRLRAIGLHTSSP